MKLTIVGSGDAFGSGGRGNTCFWLETAKATLLIDCGVSALPARRAAHSGSWSPAGRDFTCRGQRHRYGIV